MNRRMRRAPWILLSTLGLTFAVAALQPAPAQDGPLQRAGRALDKAGKNIRSHIEAEVTRVQISAQEREVLNRVVRRIEWDKQFVRSTMRIEAQAGGTIVLRGSVPDAVAKRRAVDLTESTVGVTRVVDELAILGQVQVIETSPNPRPIESTPAPPQTPDPLPIPETPGPAPKRPIE